jgi:hypothetical protein
MARKTRASAAAAARNSSRLINILRGSPERRLRWLLEFSEADSEAFSENQLADFYSGLFFLQTGVGRSAATLNPAKRQAVLQTHHQLRGLFMELANGNNFAFDAPGISWWFKPPKPRQAGMRSSGRIERLSDEGLGDSHLPAGIMFKAADLLDAIGADRLRACPLALRETGGRCGQVFLANGRQRFCSAQHAQQSAFRAYLRRGGDIERKLRR